MKPPLVSLDEQPGKTVGQLKSTALDYDKLVEAAEALMPQLPFPEGIYRFRSFEEANEWTEKHILKAAIKRNRERRKGAI